MYGHTTHTHTHMHVCMLPIYKVNLPIGPHNIWEWSYLRHWTIKWLAGELYSWEQRWWTERRVNFVCLFMHSTMTWFVLFSLISFWYLEYCPSEFYCWLWQSMSQSNSKLYFSNHVVFVYDIALWKSDDFIRYLPNNASLAIVSCKAIFT